MRGILVAMSKRYWLAAIAAGLGITAASGWYGWREMNVYQLEHAKQRNQVAAYDAEEAEQSLKICIDEPRTAFFDILVCLAKRADANRHAKRADHDLKAQQDMARWAFGLFLISIPGLLISAVGLTALFWSLSQTRASIRDNREIGEAQVRAYLSIISGRFSIYGDVLFLDLKVRNSGQSPSRKGSIHWELKYTEWTPDVGNLAKIERTIPLRATPVGAITANSDNGIVEDRFSTEDGITEWFFERNRSNFYVRCKLVWQDVFTIKCDETFLLSAQRDLDYVASRDGPDTVGSLTVVAERNATK